MEQRKDMKKMLVSGRTPVVNISLESFNHGIMKSGARQVGPEVNWAPTTTGPRGKPHSIRVVLTSALERVVLDVQHVRGLTTEGTKPILKVGAVVRAAVTTILPPPKPGPCVTLGSARYSQGKEVRGLVDKGGKHNDLVGVHGRSPYPDSTSQVRGESVFTDQLVKKTLLNHVSATIATRDSTGPGGEESRPEAVAKQFHEHVIQGSEVIYPACYC